MVRIVIVGQNHPMLHELMRRGSFDLIGSACYSGRIKRGESHVEVEVICINCPEIVDAIKPDWTIEDATWRSNKRHLSVRPPGTKRPGVIKVKANNEKAVSLAANQLLAIICPTRRKQSFGRSLRSYRHTVLSPG